MIKRFLLFITGLIATIILVTALLAINLLQNMSVIIRPFSKKYFRLFNTLCAASWWRAIIFTLVRLQGFTLILTGDPIPRQENALLICNHQAMTDVLCILSFGCLNSRQGDLKWFVKEILKYVPGIGWGLCFLDCLFVKRHWASDQASIERTFKNYNLNKIPIWLVSFLEGTRFSQKKVLLNREYANLKSLKVPQYVLLPRTKGFIAAIHGLNTHIDAIYDITIGYLNRPPTLIETLVGRAGPIHMHVRRFGINSLPKDNAALIQWIYQLYQEKDLMLKYFHEFGNFPTIK